MHRYGLGKGSISAGSALLVMTLAPGLAGAQGPAATRTFESSQFHFTVALPAGCRHEVGPGTIDAVCSADFDPGRSAVVSRAGALLLAVAAETVAEDAGRTASELQRHFTLAGFKEELAEAVCGESDKARVKVGNVKDVVEGTSVIYTADIVCAEVDFLQIGERRASVRHVITPGVRYRLMARTLAESFEQQRETTEAFFASFRVLPAGN